MLEVLATFWDWVEEDRSRQLPASERLLHGLLTINYGVLLALLAPVLLDWVRLPTGATFVDYGWWSWLATLFAVVAFVFAMKDLLASRRARAWQDERQEELAALAAGLAPETHVLVTGATGLIGRRLVASLLAAGHRVTVVSRDPEKAARLGSPLTIVERVGDVPAEQRVDAIVHLAGAPVSGGLLTERRKQVLLASRTRIADELRALVDRLAVRPSVWVNASAIGWYARCNPELADTARCWSDESGEPGADFPAELCAGIERAGQHPDVRSVQARFGLVLSREGGMLGQLLPAFDLGVGTVLGDGRHWQSWIHRDDAVRAIVLAIADRGVSGALNVTAPNPVRFSTLATELGRALKRPVLFRVPAGPLVFVLGGLARDLLLASHRVVPGRLTERDFRFPARRRGVGVA